MPQIDLQTITLVLVLFSLASAIAVMVVAWGRPANDGLQWWGWSLVVQCLSYGAFVMRAAGWNYPSILGSNLLVSATIALEVRAVVDFQGLKVLSALVWAPVIASGVCAALFPEAHATRIALTSIVHAGQAAMLGWAAYRQPPEFPRERGRVLMLAGCTLLVAMFLGRIIGALTMPPISMTVTDDLQAMSYFVALFVIMINTMGYFSMHMERAETQLLHEATHDALTGIPNRRAAMQTLEREWSRAQRAGTPLAVLMIDLDHFKKVNDSYGHQVGDTVLHEMARRIRLRLRSQDTVARYGGEEFLVVLPDTDAEGAMAVAEELRQHAGAPIFTGGRRVEVTVSVGVHSRLVGRGDQPSDIMVTAADRALYRAKESGRNRSILEPSLA